MMNWTEKDLLQIICGFAAIHLSPLNARTKKTRRFLDWLSRFRLSNYENWLRRGNKAMTPPEELKPLLKPCPMCGKENVESSPRTFYHEGVCLLANHVLYAEDWNSAYCWKKIADLEAQNQQLRAENEDLKAQMRYIDTSIYGVAIEQDGKRIPPEDFYKSPWEQLSDELAEALLHDKYCGECGESGCESCSECKSKEALQKYEAMKKHESNQI
jgi:hypothetical protein